jgi:hypothetical protein
MYNQLCLSWRWKHIEYGPSRKISLLLFLKHTSSSASRRTSYFFSINVWKWIFTSIWSSIKKFLPDDLSKSELKQIWLGIDYFHSKSMLPRDLKPQNRSYYKCTNVFYFWWSMYLLIIVLLSVFQLFLVLIRLDWLIEISWLRTRTIFSNANAHVYTWCGQTCAKKYYRKSNKIDSLLISKL